MTNFIKSEFNKEEKMKQRIEWSDFQEYWIKWLGEDTSLRFSQAFLDEFFPSVADPEILYEKDPTTAYGKIYEKYVKN